MQFIEELYDLIHDEIEISRNYAEKSILLKSEGKNECAEKFEQMAKESLSHIEKISDYIQERVQQLTECYTLPSAMRKQWNYRGAQYKERISLIEQLLSM